MDSKIRGRFLIIFGVVLVCVLGLVWGNSLTAFPRNITELRENLRNRIRLGLDLRGGAHLILQVHVEDAVNITTDQTIDRLKDELKTKNIPYDQVQKTDSTHILIKGIPQEKSGDFQNMAASQFTDWDSGQAPGDLQAHTLSMKSSAAATLRNQALEQAKETISNRINQLGVQEPEIADYGQGDYELVVQLPGVDDLNRVKDIIQSTALLELKIVHDDHPYASKEEALAAHGGVLPPDTQLLSGKAQGGSENSQSDVWYIVDRIAAITGRDLKGGAQATVDRNGRPGVNFYLDRDGATRFERVTGQNVGRLLAIVLDNGVVDAPVIQSQIKDQGIIEGLPTQQYAADLALKLNSGALPASIRYEQQETVGPSLGADSIRAGVVASIVGFVAIMSFMLVYYKGAGINADIALILNLLILMAAFAFIDAVLTLPGIAGIILTVGMGVDSNVLIFERIREELRSGKAVGTAVSGGFSHAFTTIIDTHVTTVVSAAILFSFGTGPIKGFAVTLTIGLVANLFTSVYVSRSIFEYVLSRRGKGEALSI
ncbi:MAG TPA: protein translocase subunit SecD [Terriglobia bacterium]|nr:protein translocase subunit SecD [Terriglobia bacterium]